MITKEPEIGEKYHGRVVGVQAFGAFVELFPGKDGLLHISRVAKGRVDKVEDVLNVGDELEVEIIDIDDRGKVSLDRIDKPDAPPSSGKPAGDRPQGDRPSGDRGPRPGDRSGGSGGPRRRH
jgi:polyribonucleotide nucleotidyltransferase